ncbi:hypothetical protein ABIF38_007514 [Bradyrhizobium japonicum]|nr:hypothetical protein [Bradyrhizobium elkanii]MCS3574302.1 hypothetical protein [Bradyrhizobium elkanii]MCS3593007.1 hypothetical protein [Bradyrhizobium elkanii]MCS3622452.1 hypothetical protein [Bradyrhizobium elkanii]MCW2109082.1 hypothetical protein [Bradyrhizobium elkanii]
MHATIALALPRGVLMMQSLGPTVLSGQRYDP